MIIELLENEPTVRFLMVVPAVICALCLPQTCLFYFLFLQYTASTLQTKRLGAGISWHIII